LCRPGDRRCVGQVTDVCGAVRHADRSRSIPVGYPGRRMIEHDCNPAARQAVYPVDEEHDPDPPTPQQGAGRDLTRQPYPGATATPAASTEAPQPGRASPGKARSRRVGASGAGAESAAWLWTPIRAGVRNLICEPQLRGHCARNLQLDRTGEAHHYVPAGSSSDVSSAGGGVALARTRGSRASAAAGDMSGGSGNGVPGW
jgi:hypothetical protein